MLSKKYRGKYYILWREDKNHLTRGIVTFLPESTFCSAITISIVIKIRYRNAAVAVARYLIIVTRTMQSDSLENLKFIVITNYFVYSGVFVPRFPFICLVYTTFVYENKNQKSRGTFPIYFESPSSSYCRRFHRMQSSHRACSTFADESWSGK